MSDSPEQILLTAEPPLRHRAAVRAVRWLVALAGCGVVVLVGTTAPAQDLASERGPDSDVVVLHDGNNPLQAHMFIFKDDTGDLQFDDLRGAPPQMFHAMAPDARGPDRR